MNINKDFKKKFNNFSVGVFGVHFHYKKYDMAEHLNGK